MALSRGRKRVKEELPMTVSVPALSAVIGETRRAFERTGKPIVMSQVLESSNHAMQRQLADVTRVFKEKEALSKDELERLTVSPIVSRYLDTLAEAVRGIETKNETHALNVENALSEVRASVSAGLSDISQTLENFASRLTACEALVNALSENVERRFAQTQTVNAPKSELSARAGVQAQARQSSVLRQAPAMIQAVPDLTPSSQPKVTTDSPQIDRAQALELLATLFKTR
jgi:hypothetical protein